MSHRIECRDGPLAYLITFRCYGTWLPGDSRGWIDRRGNAYDTTYWAENAHIQHWAAKQLAPQAGLLDEMGRKTVRATIEQVCRHRQWNLFALHVGINHVHVVLAIDGPPEAALNAFKAWSTRHLRALGRVEPGHRIWSRHGSTRYLWTTDAVERACHYVLEGQDNQYRDRQGAGRH